MNAYRSLVALFAILLASLGALLWPVVALFIASGIVTVLAARRLPGLMDFFQAFRSNDFFWTFATRGLVTLGIFSILPFMELYFRDVVRTPAAGAASAPSQASATRIGKPPFGQSRDAGPTRGSRASPRRARPGGAH